MSSYKGFGIEGFDRPREKMVRAQIDRIERAVSRRGVRAEPVKVQAEVEPDVSHPKYGDFCGYAQVAYYNPDSDIIVLSGQTDKDWEESIRFMPHEYAHRIDVVHLHDRAKDEWWADRFMEWVNDGKDGGEKFEEHLKRALASMKANGGETPVVNPEIRGRITRRGGGPGRGWHKQPRRHARASVKGWFRRLRRRLRR